MMKHFLLTAALCMSISTTIFGQEHSDEMTPFITGLSIPGGILYDNNGVLYIAEWGNERVCRYAAMGI